MTHLVHFFINFYYPLCYLYWLRQGEQVDENAKRHCAFIIYHQFYELWSWGASEARVVDSFAITSYVDRHRYSPFRGVEKRSYCESIIRGTLNYHEKQVEDVPYIHNKSMQKNFVKVQYLWDFCSLKWPIHHKWFKICHIFTIQNSKFTYTCFFS